jgi:NAD(P)-dependent dehydrogenase (short-subunit alcohol dehydrogenase family)
MAGLRTLGDIVERLGSTVTPPVTPIVTPAPVAAPPADDRYIDQLVAAPAAGMVASFAGKPLLVIDGGSGRGEAVVAAARAAGLDARLATEPADGAGGILILTGLRPITSPEEGLALSRDAFASVVATARLAQKPALLALPLELGGGLGLEPAPGHQAWTAGLLGLGRTAALELPGVAVRLIDLGGADEAALIEELRAGGLETEVALRPSRRTIQAQPAPAPGGDLPFDALDVVVVTGGGRGVTAVTALALARMVPLRFALLGRTPLEEEPAALATLREEPALKAALRALHPADSPAALGRRASALLAAREVRATLQALRQTGSEAIYVAADVADPASLAAALSGVRAALGPIAAVIHGAGVLADKRLADKTLDQLNRVLAPKLGGLVALLAATAADPLKALVLFSSVAGRTGNPGQSDYALANSAMDAVAQRLAADRPGLKVVSVAWGPWEGGMVTPALKARFAEAGIPVIAHDRGGQMLIEELCAPGPVRVVRGGAPRPEGLAPASHTRALRLDLPVDADRYRFLTDHAIAGKAVVPVALVLEWITRAARLLRPDLHLVTLGDVQVKKGLVLPASGALDLRLEVNELSNGEGSVVSVALRDEAGLLRYAATATLAARRPLPPAAPRLRLQPWAADAEIYDGHVLFHGPQLQVIRGMEGVGEEGISGELAGLHEVGWPIAGWTLDPALLDGGLQLAVLWSKHMLGGAALPTGIESLHTWTDAPGAGRVRAVLKGREQGRNRTLSDLFLIDEAGALVAALRGVETHRRLP